MEKQLILLFSLLLIFILIGCSNDPLKDILDSIEIDKEVYTNLDLKSEYSLNGVTATAKWHSTASSVISSTGEIVVDTTDRKVVLQLKLSLNGKELQKNFEITVKGSTDLLLLYALYNSQIKNIPTEINADLNLLSTYIQDGKEITAIWQSNKPDVIGNTGIVNRGDFDQEVELTVVLSLNLATRIEKLNVTVLKKEEADPVNYFHKASLYLGQVLNEAAKPSLPACFAGAIYRKVVSSRDYWLGIEGVITLPDLTLDQLRYDATKLSYYLDNPSIYMGGNAQNESDIGLTWSIGHTSSTNTQLTKQGIAFRPFWRYITSMETGKRENIYKNANVSNYEFYYFPGDKLRMSVFSPKPNYLQMRIELIELTSIPTFMEARAKYNLGDNFNRVFITDPFPSEGMGNLRAEFKRVNAIDQVANEGKATINTNSKVENAIWHEVYLYRRINDILYKVPMNDLRTAKMACPLGKTQNGDFTNAFSISYTGVNKDLGGEIITIDPKNGTGKLYNTSNVFIIPKKGKEEI